MRMRVYIGLMMAAGLCVPLVAGAFDFGRFADETEGGIQVDTTKAKSKLYKSDVTYGTHDLTGIGVVTDKTTTGSVKFRGAYGDNTHKLTDEQMEGIRRKTYERLYGKTEDKVLGYDLTSGNPDGYTAHKDIRTSSDKGSVDKLFNNNNVDYNVVRTDSFPGKDGITKDYNFFSDWKDKTVTSDRFVKDADTVEMGDGATDLEAVVTDNTGDIEAADTSLEKKNALDNMRKDGVAGETDAEIEKKNALENKRNEQTDAEKQEQKVADSCKSPEKQAEAKAIAGDGDKIASNLKDAGIPPSEQCIAAGKKALEACAKGDGKTMMEIYDKLADECKTPIAVEDKNPQSRMTADNGATLEGPVNMLDQMKESLGKLFQLDANGQANPLQQMLMAGLMQKIQDMTSGGGGGGGSSSDDGKDDTDDKPLTCDKVTKTSSKTVTTYLDAETGEEVDKDAEDKAKEKAAAAAKTTKGTVMPNFGDDAKTGKDDTAKDDDAKLIVVKTVITTQSCKNGNLRVKAVETKTYPDGKVEVEKEEDIIN